MLKIKAKRLAAEAGQATAQIAEIRTSITSLKDEDLLDLVDIFSGETQTFLGNVATAEMKRRNLSLGAESDS